MSSRSPQRADTASFVIDQSLQPPPLAGARCRAACLPGRPGSPCTDPSHQRCERRAHCFLSAHSLASSWLSWCGQKEQKAAAAHDWLATDLARGALAA
eukprot:768514-Pleurochrysis_carterae.AAC.5